jgi:APA family basic amino acid/polyamine antiporter
MTIEALAGQKIEAGKSELLRVLGVGFGVAVVVGGVLGQGIMRAPGIVAGALPSPWWILAAWLVGGLMCFVDAFATVELASAAPRAGGPYAFVSRAFGPFAGTMIGWSDWLNYVVANGFLGVVFAEYVHRLGFFEAVPIGVLAVGLVAVTWLLNGLGTRASGMSQNVGSALKAAALLGIIALCFAAPRAAPAAPPPLHPALTLAALAIGLRAVYNTYSGWNACAYFCEEVHLPGRNIARSTFIGLAVVTGLYLLVNAALLHALTIPQIAASTLPVADAVGVVLGPHGAVVTTVFALISVAAITNLGVMCCTRIAFGMARDGVLPSPLAIVGKSGAPQIALAVTVLGSAICASTGVYETLIAISAVFAIVVCMGVDLAALWLRRTEPDLDRPYRMPFFPLPPLLGLAINTALLIALTLEDPLHSLTGMAMLVAIAAGYLLAHLFRLRRTPV